MRLLKAILAVALLCLVPTASLADLAPYSQDFEGLPQGDPAALGNDGWLVFANVFDGATYLYGYGTYPAPNGGPAFSAIDSGQGGPEQGDQQLSIYSDYNNTDHGNGYTIEANVFQEQIIGAGDVGETWTFSFDAKPGNINDPGDPNCPCTSTGVAFIKTLDPANGFALTNFISVETTFLPDTWQSLELSIEIDPTLPDQILQIGFLSTATLYQPSGVFYDNINFVPEMTGDDVPASSAWGSVVLIALLLGISLIYMKRRVAQS